MIIKSFPLKQVVWKAWLLAAALSLVAASAALAAAGDLDLTFSKDGRIVTSIVTGQPSQAFALAIQPNGRTVAVGETVASSVNTNIAVARFSLSGFFDPAFNGTGRRVVDLAGQEFGLGTAVDPVTGKIVVAGSKCRSGVGCDLVMLRFNPAGGLDTTFNGTGKRVDDYGGANNGGSPGVAIQPDGSIVVSGFMFNAATENYDFAVYRYTSAGARDVTFSGDGRQRFGFGAGRHDFASSLALQPDGKILVAGETCGVTGGSCNFAMARLNIDGSLDPTFRSTGRVSTDFLGDDRAYDLALQPDGKIVIVGIKYAPGTSYFAMARYSPNGFLDTTFNTTGKKVFNFSGNANRDGARSVAVQGNGKIVVCGSVFNGSNDDFALARFTSSGGSDLTFSGDGKLAINFGGNDSCAGLALQPDGKYVLAGYRLLSGFRTFALARVLP